MATLTDILLLVDLATGESAFGSFANWGEVTDGNLAILEAKTGQTSEIAVTTANVTLTDEEELSLVIKATGALTAARSILTNDRKGFWIVSNETTGAFALTFKPTSGSGIAVPRGARWILYCDGTDIHRVGTKPYTTTHFTASGTWTKPAGCIMAVVLGVGAGGGGGGINGIAGTTAAGAGGGGSGGYGYTDPIDVSLIADATVTIGAAGTAGTASVNGGDGGDTTVVLGAVTYTWGGGGGGGSQNMSTWTFHFGGGGGGGLGINLQYFSSGHGHYGAGSAGNGAHGGHGGMSPLGNGGFGLPKIGAGVQAGEDGYNYGGGGSGACGVNSASDANGGAGAPGKVTFLEFY